MDFQDKKTRRIARQNVNHINTINEQLADVMNQKNSIVGLGDSKTIGQCALPDSSNYMWMYYSRYLFVALAQAKQRLVFKGVFGHSGYTITQILNGGYVDNVIALKPTFCVLNIGINDVANTVAIATSKADYTTILNKLLSANIKVIVTTLSPYNGITTTQKQQRASLNNFIKTLALTIPNVYLFDLASCGVADNTGDSYISGMSDDGLHENDKGGQYGGKMLADLFKTLVPPFNVLPSSAYDTSNLIVNNPLFLTDSDANGKADSWSFVDGTGMTYSLVDRTDGMTGKWQQIVQTSGTTYMAQTNTAVGTSWKIGDKVRGMIEFEIDNAPSSLSLSVSFQPNANSYTNHQYKSAFNFTGHSGVLQTPDVVIPSGTTSLQFMITITGACTIRLGRPKMEIVV